MSDASMVPATSCDISLSAAAAAQIKRITAEHDRRYLRVAVQGGGCSGFSYTFDFADDAETDDLLITRDGAAVVIDSASQAFLTGAEIHFEDALLGAAFTVRNPNATSACGCGVSFSI